MLQIHYIRVFCARYLLFLLAGLVLVALVACSNGASPDDGGSNSSSSGNKPSNASSSSVGIVDGEWPFVDSSGEELQPTPGIDELKLSNVISINYNGRTVEIDNSYDEVTISASDGNVGVSVPNTSSTEYNFILSGTTSNGSLKFYGDVKKGLYLNGVSITNSTGPAINIQKSKRVTVHLINGTQNLLEDGSNYDESGKNAKGTFFSEGKLEFDGSGSLEVKGKFKHAIVADNDIEIKNGKITVSEAASDGIHANDTIKVKGGFLKISSTGDAIQSEKEDNKIIITGGKIKAITAGPKSHGITSEGPISISGDAIVQISVLGNGSKGIKSGSKETRSGVEFKGGKTFIKASGTKHIDNDDESNSAGIKLTGDLSIEGGELTIKSPGNGAKGANTDGNATIKNGTVNIDADDDAMKVHGNLRIEGGNVTLNSKNKQAIDATSCTKTGGTVNVQCGSF